MQLLLTNEEIKGRHISSLLENAEHVCYNCGWKRARFIPVLNP
jgi:hypothetical protein